MILINVENAEKRWLKKVMKSTVVAAVDTVTNLSLIHISEPTRPY